MLTLLFFDENNYEVMRAPMNSKSRDYERLLSVVTINDEHAKPTIGSEEGMGITCKDGIYAELCLKLWFESD